MRKATTKPAATEHEIQAAIVDALRLAGFTVRETTAYRQKGPSGVDKGIADLLIFHERLSQNQTGTCLCLEVKRVGNWNFSSDEQKEACHKGEFFVVNNPVAALRLANSWLEFNVRGVVMIEGLHLIDTFAPAINKSRATLKALEEGGA